MQLHSALLIISAAGICAVTQSCGTLTCRRRWHLALATFTICGCAQPRYGPITVPVRQSWCTLSPPEFRRIMTDNRLPVLGSLGDILGAIIVWNHLSFPRLTWRLRLPRRATACSRYDRACSLLGRTTRFWKGRISVGRCQNFEAPRRAISARSAP